MELGSRFFLTAVCLGIGLAVDAFSVSLANGLHAPQMKTRNMCGMAATFAAFQALMPLFGWLCIHTIVQSFRTLESLLSPIAFLLLSAIGTKMIWEGSHPRDRIKDSAEPHSGIATLALQGIATSVDALSVGFTIANYDLCPALLTAGVIAWVTFILCLFGILIGKRVGTRLSGKAELFGGLLLIAIGLEVLLTDLF